MRGRRPPSLGGEGGGREEKGGDMIRKDQKTERGKLKGGWGDGK